MLQRLVPMVIVLAVLIGGGVLVNKNLHANNSASQNQYRIALVKTDLVKKTVTATGVLTPWQTVDIKSRAGGRVVRLPVEEGFRLKKGQVIAEIDPSDTLLTYNSARADIDANHARVDETRKALALQKQATQINEQTARANLVAARAGANAARAKYESAKSQAGAQTELTETAVENARATLAAENDHLDQMVSALHPQQSAQAGANLKQAVANQINAQAQLNRQKALLAKGFVAQSLVDQAEATYEVAQANVDAAREKVDTIKPELETDLKAQKARVRQAEAALKTTEANRVQIALRKQDAEAAYAAYQQSLAEVKQSEARLQQTRADRLNDAIRQTQIAQAQASGASANAKLANASVQLQETHVTSPGETIVLKKYVEQGALITSGISFNSTGTSIVQLGDVSRMYVDVQVDETDIANVDDGQKVDVTFDAYSTVPFEGKVIKVQPQAVIDQNVTTVHVRVEVDNSDTKFRLLKPGMNATCEFVINKKEDAVCVPNEALKSEADGSHYVELALGGKPAPAEKDAEADPNLLVGVGVRKQTVEIGLEGNETTEVTNGLKGGERIITQTIEPSAASPASGSAPFRGGGPGPGRR